MEGKAEEGGIKNKVLSLSHTHKIRELRILHHFDTFLVEFLIQ
jgi:hypothetical protein